MHVLTSIYIYALCFSVQAAAASVAVGSNGAAAAGMADFVGNPVPNCTQNFINGHSTAAAIGGAGLFAHPDHFASVQMMLARSYDGEAAAARLGMNGGGAGGGGYGFGYSSGMGAGHGVVSGLGQVGSGGQFLKPGTAGGDEQPTAAQ